MPRDEKRRQQALQRKAGKDKLRRSPQAGASGFGGSLATWRLAATWPLHECLVSRDWQTEGELVQVVVARRSLHGEIAAAAFMVDTGCLGVKSAVLRLLRSASDYEHGFRAELMRSQPLQSADLNLAAKIIREAVGYARELGFHPDPDYKTAALLLAGADPEACPERVPLGKDGKPFYCAGPYDKVPEVLAQLARAVGADNFQYFVPMSDPSAFADDDDASGLRRLLGNTVGRLLR